MDKSRKRKRSDAGAKPTKSVDRTALIAAEMQAVRQGIPLQHTLSAHVEQHLDAYLAQCPLLPSGDDAGDSIGGVTRIDATAFRDAFVDLVLGEARPETSTAFSLRTYMDMLRELVNESLCPMVARANPRHRNVGVELAIESEELATMQGLARAQLLHSGDVTINDNRNLLALYHDRELQYLERYADVNRARVTFFVSRLSSGVLLCALIVPPLALHYELNSRVNDYVRSYATLQQEVRDLKRQKTQGDAELEETRRIAAHHNTRVQALEREVTELRATLQAKTPSPPPGKQLNKVTKPVRVESPVVVVAVAKPKRAVVPTIATTTAKPSPRKKSVNKGSGLFPNGPRRR